MKKIFLLLVFLLPSVGLYSQISKGGVPPSHVQRSLRSQAIIPTLELQSMNVDKLLMEDKANEIPFRYGVVEDVQLDIKSGLQTPLDSGCIWRYEIVSDNAKSIKLIFNQFIIPAGAELFVYNSDYSLIYGAFTFANMNADSSFAIVDFPGKKVIIEYYEPSDAEFNGKLIIDQISKAYRDLDYLMSTQEDSAYVDVNCATGIEWQLEKHAVCKYTFVEGVYSYICSGALINNVNNDGTPYFLTANHCVSSSTVATTVTAYFNYETKGCGMEQKSYKTLSGVNLITTGENSDFTLLRFTSTPPATYQPYYAGWDLTNTASSTVGIHHPLGLVKKISIDKDPSITYNGLIKWDNGSLSPSNTHWVVYFDEGKTAGGSSGSPLFNQNKRIIGQLHGGGDNDSYYGKLNYSWVNSDSAGSARTGYYELKNYLAEDSTINYLNGYTPSTNMPEAIFTTEFEYACVGIPLQMIDYSCFDVSSWKWQFTPSTVTYINGTTPTSQNPLVSFDEAGTYDIKLIVKNNVGSDSITHPSAIIAGSKIVVSKQTFTKSGGCIYDIDSIVISASGASSYKWELNNDTSFFELKERNNSQAVITLKTGMFPDSTVNVRGFVIGTQGSCSDTCDFSIELILPSNDNIAYAKRIDVGQNGPFSNICASVEAGEPVPPLDFSCIGQSGWCDEYGTGLNIVEHSVWFYFYGPKSGAVSIEANDMDGQIALYDADSYEAILDGNYTLVAANDDRSSDNPNSKINKIAVSPDKLYWLQFDGSGGGVEGNFHILLNEEIADTTTTIKSIADWSKTNLTFYPQPAFDYLEIKGGILESVNIVQIRIYDLMGNRIYSGEHSVQQDRVTVNLENAWPDGIYVLSIIGNNVVATGKFFKQKNKL